MKKLIIFDFFGVICDEVGLPWFREYFPKESFVEIKEKKCLPLDKGDLKEEIFFKDVAVLAGAPDEDVRQDWMGRVKINTDVLDLISSLSGDGYQVVLLSNAASKFIRDILAKYSLEKYFTDIVISAEVHMSKPDPAIYQLTLERNNAKPEEAVFIDDNSNNVTTARMLGIHGVVFKDVVALKNELDVLLK